MSAPESEIIFPFDAYYVAEKPFADISTIIRKTAMHLAGTTSPERIHVQQAMNVLAEDKDLLIKILRQFHTADAASLHSKS